MVFDAIILWHQIPYINNLSMHGDERSTATSTANQATSVSAAPVVTPNARLWQLSS